ncbi:MAG: glycosyltransferase family A protein [Pseudomonadota bacterium]
MNADAAAAAERDASWTVVIPYFNEEHFIRATLETLAAQSFRDFRLILVDNGSTDASRAIVEDFQRAHPEMSIALLEEREPGQAAALKCGIDAVRSDFTAICDADTHYPPDYLKTADRLLRQRPEAAAALAASG